MKKLALVIVMTVAALCVRAAELDWTTDLPKAQAKAKEGSKLVLMDFTGSDWCVWCKRLNKEIFSTPEFAEFAKENLVLVELDFPSKKPQSAELKKANEALGKKYNIEGYPTVIVLNAAGKRSGSWAIRRAARSRSLRNWKS